jgi:membrane-bound metal-dependent hydrolase YbcI (DUF457 family)
MSLPLAHALAGASITVALWPERTPAGFRRALTVGSLLAVCPDVDFVLNRLGVLGAGWHHGFTHSIGFALVIGVIAGVIASRALGLPGWRGVLACVLPVLSHLLLDYWVTQSEGLELWWPLTDQRSKLGIEELSYYQFATLRRGLAEWGKLCVIEVALFGPLLLLSVRANRWRYAI